jgi:tRNA pseudouridine65 synthase
VQIQLLADHPDWVIVAKPPNIAVHRSRMVSDRVVLLQLVRDTVGCKVHPVHRLDRGTSGCLLFAKNRAATATLQRAMNDARATKSYVAFTRGWAQPGGSALLDMPLTHEGKTKEAQTFIQCVAALKDPRCAIILAQLRTGRWHQIRRHLQRLSMPVLMDSTHGDTRTNRWWRDTYGLDRLALHCLSLHIPLQDDEDIHVVCPPPADLIAVWKQLPLWEEAKRAIPALQEIP